MARRAPVPLAWRWERHWLDVSSRVVGRAPVRGNVYRARGRCSCGVEFNSERNPDGSRRNSNTMDRGMVIEAWKDHVEEAWLGRCLDCDGAGERVLNPAWPSGEGPHSEKCSSCGGSGRADG